MTHGSLFSGIGGFDLAAHWMGWENVFHCELNKFGQQVLKYHFPKSISYADITKTDFTIHHGTIDILTGGFPCQPYSVAGQRKGKEDERHLWPEMLRAIREIAPRYVVGENVRGLLSFNGGMVFDEVCADLENLGYTVAPCIIPAVGVNAPHKRERIWFIAHAIGSRHGGRTETPGNDNAERIGGMDENIGQHRDEIRSEIERCSGVIANTECIRRNEVGNDKRIIKEAQQEKCREEQFSGTIGSQDRWRKFPLESPICSRNDGLSSRLDGITFSKWRNESIKAGGNAIVPQVAYEIFKAIEQINKLNLKN
jgi:DNA (cytosine-5)-methyltransferase 1